MRRSDAGRGGKRRERFSDGGFKGRSLSVGGVARVEIFSVVGYELLRRGAV